MIALETSSLLSLAVLSFAAARLALAPAWRWRCSTASADG